VILLQIITAIFAIALALLNKWPVIIFREFVKDNRQLEIDFHAANAAVKIMWAVMLTFRTQPTIVFTFLINVFIYLLIQWLVFDIALNIFTGKKWDYLGQTAWLDKTIKNGKVKAGVVVVAIILLNFLIYKQ
jgi:hypothetical protein